MIGITSRFRRFSTIAALATAALVPAFGQIGDTAAQQINAILQAKAGFTPAQQKMSSDLAFATIASQQQLSSAFPVGIVNSTLMTSGSITVDIHGTISDAVLQQVASSGGTVIFSAPGFSELRASLPLSGVSDLAALADVSSIRVADTMVVNRVGRMSSEAVRPPYRSAEERRANVRRQLQSALPLFASKHSLGLGLPPDMSFFVGAVTSQGYVTHQANSVNGLGFNGTGVRVGVLSDSASPARVAALIASGDLPADVTVLPGQAGTGSDEGTAMMEIVHDMAPGAKLFFATAFNGAASFASNIIALQSTYLCDIIVDDVTYFNEGAFQDGLIAQAVNTVTAAGAMYFSSAANSGNLTLGTSGTWEGDFVNGGPVSGPIAVGGETGFVHNFGSQNFNVLTSSSSFISLKWSDALAASGNDYDLFILNSTGTTLKGFSAARQSGTQDPFEAIAQGTGCGTASASGYCPSAGDRIVVVLFSGNPRALRIDTNRGRLSIATSGSTFGHNAGLNTISIAATAWNSAHAGTRPFTGAANPIETFSSDGPRKIFYQPDGTPITPGNFLFGTNGGTTLQKPDATAADGVYTHTPGFLPFFGTSAAAPHAAGIAALVKSARPTLTNAQIKSVLLTTTVDNMAPGIDRDSGYGILMALPAVQAALALP